MLSERKPLLKSLPVRVKSVLLMVVIGRVLEHARKQDKRRLSLAVIKAPIPKYNRIN